MAEKTRSGNGRHLLGEGDMVAVVDGEGNEVGAVPKHWSKDQVAAGLSKTARKPRATPVTAGARAQVDEAVARVREEYEAKLAELNARLEGQKPAS